MEPIKIAGLTLKSEPKVETDLTPVAPETVGDVLNNLDSNDLPEPFPTEDWVEEVEAEMGTDISYDIKHLIVRAEALPSTDNNIRVIAKLKGALELLNS